MRGLLTIVVALTMISCATVMESPMQQELEQKQEEVDHSDDLHFGWNYIFPFENDINYYIIVFLSYELTPLAVVAPIDFYVHPSQIEPSYFGTWVWSIKYRTSFNGNDDHYEMGIEATPEDAVDAANIFMAEFPVA